MKISAFYQFAILFVCLIPLTLVALTDSSASWRPAVLLVSSVIVLIVAFLVPVFFFLKDKNKGIEQLAGLIATEASLILFIWGIVGALLKSNPGILEIVKQTLTGF